MEATFSRSQAATTASTSSWLRAQSTKATAASLAYPRRRRSGITLYPISTTPSAGRPLETSITDDRLRRPLDDDPDAEVRRPTIAARLKGQHVKQIALRPIGRQRRTERRFRSRSITGELRGDRRRQGPQLKPPSAQAEGHRNRLGHIAAGPAASLDVIARRRFA